MALDILIAIPLLWGLFRGVFKGLITEMMAILAIILGVVGARTWGMLLAAWLTQHTTWALPVCQALAYVGIFLGITIALSLLAMILSKLFKAIHLDGINRILGGLFGLLKWGLLIMVIVFCIHLLDMQFHFLPENWVDSSRLYSLFVEWSSWLFSNSYEGLSHGF